VSTRTKIKAERTARLLMGGFVVFAVLVVLAIVVIVVRACSSFNSGMGSSADVATVPNVVGMSEQDAIATLQNAGLAPKKVQSDFNETVPVGSVYNQNPPARHHTKQGTVVSLYISLGRGQFTVPDMAGKDVTAATQLLINQGFTLGEISKVYRPDLPAGQVVSQEPVPGRVFPATTSIDLVVADVENLPAITMPALIGLPLATAEQQLATAGLQLSQVTYAPSETAEAGSVLTQNPGTTTPAEFGAHVELTVAMPAADAAQRNKTVNLHIPIPAGQAKQRVRIKVFDALGTDVYYDNELEPGGVLDKRVNIEGKATIVIFLRDMEKPYRKEVIPYTGQEPATADTPPAASPPAQTTPAPEAGGY
jgi:beta-lactam-binding protein with PASTA domain